MTDATTVTIEDLESSVETALWNYTPVRESLSDLQVAVSADGKVTISGSVRSGLIKDGVLEALRWVPGVTEVVDGLVADSELEIEVAAALAGDPKLKALSPGTIAVHCHLGEVALVGQLEDTSLQAIAVELAQQVSGVQSVRNLMTTG